MKCTTTIIRRRRPDEARKARRWSASSAPNSTNPDATTVVKLGLPRITACAHRVRGSYHCRPPPLLTSLSLSLSLSLR